MRNGPIGSGYRASPPTDPFSPPELTNTSFRYERVSRGGD